MYLIFDTETTGLPKKFKAPITDTDNWPRCVQIAWQLHDKDGVMVHHTDYLIKPENYNIPYDAEKVHGISTELAIKEGEKLEVVLEKFNEALQKCDFIVGHNLRFDVNIMSCEFFRKNMETKLSELHVKDTCTEKSATLCALPGGRGGKFKLPKLGELHLFLFNDKFEEAHNATADVEATARCFFELIRTEQFTDENLEQEPGYVASFIANNPKTIKPTGLKHVDLHLASLSIEKEKEKEIATVGSVKIKLDKVPKIAFSHLHNHTQHSVLQATTATTELIAKAVQNNMPAVAISDIGNMMGSFHFVKSINNHNTTVLKECKYLEEKITKSPNDVDLIEELVAKKKQTIVGIVGTELNVCADMNDKSNKDNGYQIPFFAKNEKGYRNLSYLSSQSFIEGFYYVPRVDKKLLLEHKDDIIVTTGGIYGEVPSLILQSGEKQAEEALLWYKENFKDDFYIELNRHGIEEERRVNPVLLQFAKKHNIKVIACNNNFYLNQEDSELQDILLCIKNGEKVSTPIGKGRDYRFGLENDSYYFKTTEEMCSLFSDIPEAIENTNEIVSKISKYDLARPILLPNFDIPQDFFDPQDEKDDKKHGENAYLKHLTFLGAAKRWGTLTDEIKERLTFELKTIENSGYPGYFLIVHDFIQKAKSMGVWVGPGRGSAAGSAVAYSIGITNVDPLKYNLLFERFLNPDRISLPDIDIDFDDEGRGKVIDYVINKYGASQVAQIITFGTMATKSSIRDCGRVLELPLSETDKLTKSIPPKITLKKLFGLSKKELLKTLKRSDMVAKTQRLIDLIGKDTLEGDVLKKASRIEGTVRNTGTHACGVIITPDDLRKYAPMTTARDSQMWVTQFDNSVVESAGLLKMDFLGLKTLTLLKDAIAIIKERHGIDIDIESIPLDDSSTYELFQRGDTAGIFQYESAGMQEHLKNLKPTEFSDLIAMNALYRPGPMEHIPEFIKRKLGTEKVRYELPEMKEYLKETYGITVYQEQVMLLSQKIAGFTKGEADMLRKAMGKKILEMLMRLKPKFIEGGKKNKHPEDVLNKIWKDWEAFASYAFNKSHSTCYALIGYQTAYLKAKYPAEYMASVLSNNMNDIKSVAFFIRACKKSNLEVLGPDINESVYKFTVNDKGKIRFGLGAIKGVGEGAVETIVNERKKNGAYRSIFDLTCRVDLKAANKKALEGFAYAGAFDSFKDIHRAQYFYIFENNSSIIEQASRFGQQFNKNKNASQQSLFGQDTTDIIQNPSYPDCDKWNYFLKLKYEKEVLGLYCSGHPLQQYDFEVQSFAKNTIQELNDIEKLKRKDLSFIGMVKKAEHRMSKNQKPFGSFDVEDRTDSTTVMLFGEDYLKFKHFLVDGTFLLIKGKIEPKWRNSDDFEFKISSIELVSDLKNKYTKYVNIKLNISLFTDEFYKQMVTLLKKSKGNIPIKVLAYDKQNNLTVKMYSKSIKVDPTRDLLEKLKEISGINTTLVV